MYGQIWRKPINLWGDYANIQEGPKLQFEPRSFLLRGDSTHNCNMPPYCTIDGFSQTNLEVMEVYNFISIAYNSPDNNIKIRCNESKHIQDDTFFKKVIFHQPIIPQTPGLVHETLKAA